MKDKELQEDPDETWIEGLDRREREREKEESENEEDESEEPEEDSHETFDKSMRGLVPYPRS